ncbi:DUF2946 family protein [Azospirillum humicireducens]|nr:DUF2946 family protein [Azospirillum humicireducens]
MIASANAAESGRIVICTPDGFKTVALDGRASAGDPARFGLTESELVNSDTGKSDPAISGASCPLCPLVGGLAMPPPDLRMARASVGRYGPEALPGDAIAAGWFLSTLQARAPPV